MRTHDEAIKFFRERDIVASRRDWAMGDTIVVLWNDPTTVCDRSPNLDGQEDYGFAVWLVPRANDAWDLVQDVMMHERRQSFVGLGEACNAVLALIKLFTLTESCPDCDDMRSVSFEESLSPTGLHWFLSTSCKNCGAQTKADGADALPADLRRLEIARNGTWGVFSKQEMSTASVTIIREVLGPDLASITEQKRCWPEALFRGTAAEAFYIKRLLVNCDVDADFYVLAG